MAVGFVDIGVANAIYSLCSFQLSPLLFGIQREKTGSYLSQWHDYFKCFEFCCGSPCPDFLQTVEYLVVAVIIL